MKTNYFLLFILFLTIQIGTSQNIVDKNKPIKQSIENLSIYPNPVNNRQAYIYISSKLNLTKKIEFFNVLGKQIFATNLIGKELNISNFKKGVYILKITENKISETRKLVIN